MPVDCTQRSLPCAFWCDIDRGKKWRERDGLPSPFALKMGGVKYILKKKRRGKRKKLRWIYWKLIVQWPMLASAMLRHYVAVDDERNELIWWLFTKMSSDGTTLSWPPDRPSTRKGERNTWHDIAAQSWVSLWAQGRNARIKACVKRKINLFIYLHVWFGAAEVFLTGCIASLCVHSSAWRVRNVWPLAFADVSFDLRLVRFCVCKKEDSAMQWSDSHKARTELSLHEWPPEMISTVSV